MVLSARLSRWVEATMDVVLLATSQSDPVSMGQKLGSTYLSERMGTIHGVWRCVEDRAGRPGCEWRDDGYPRGPVVPKRDAVDTIAGWQVYVDLHALDGISGTDE
jgi:hypothetical protein